MKNLRKVLALVLVVASLMGMAVMANADFTDADKISASNKQAVDVLSALDIIGGYTDGSYQPKKVVTRAEMAKMISVILNSGEDINDLYKASCTFADSKTHWAAGYIGYCATLGIISGKSETVFAPDATVTGVEAAKMMLCALQYKAENEGFTGTNWKGNVLNRANALKLFDRIAANPDAGMTRENAAQLLWNGLNKVYVDYEGGTRVEIAGVTFVTGATAVKNVEGPEDANGDPTALTLIGREFPDVTVTRSYDKWHRPVTEIAIIGEDTIVSVDNPDLVANNSVQTKTIHKLVKINGADLTDKGVTVNVHASGYDKTNSNAKPYYDYIMKMKSSTTDKVGAAGDRIEIYWDADAKVLDVLVFWTGAIKIADVSVNTTAKTTTVTTTDATGFGYGSAKDLSITFKTAETNITEDNIGDVVIANVAKLTSDSNAPYELYNLYLADVVTGTSEGTVLNSSNKHSNLYMGGKTYTCDGGIDSCKSGAFTSGEEFNVYLDEGGIAHAFLPVVETVAPEYAYVIAVDTEKASFAETTYLAQVLFADGVVEVIETKTLATAGQLCSYTVDSKNVYTLTTADDTKEAVAITKGQAIITGTKFANKNTVFVVETTANGKSQYDVYTGIKNVPSLKATNILVVENSETTDLLDIVYCLTSELAGSAAATDLEISMLYVPSGLSKYTKPAGDTEYSYYSVKAWVNGKATTVKLSPEKYDALKATKNTADALELIKGYNVDENGVVTDVIPATASGTITSAVADWSNGIITMNGVKTYIEEGTPVYAYELNSSAIEKHTIEELNVNTGSKAESLVGGWYLTDSNGNITAIYGVAKIS